MSTVTYRVTKAPSLDRLADAWKYFNRDHLPVSFSVERDHGGSDPHLVSFDIDDYRVVGLEHISAYPLKVRVQLFSPPREFGTTGRNATAVIEYPDQKGSLEQWH